MKIGIIIAMDKEFQRIREILTDTCELTEHGKQFTTGKIGHHNIIMMTSGIGKVNAAIGTVEMVNLFHPEIIISSGVAGGASTELNVQEVVVSTQTCYHDVYCGSEMQKGQIMGMPARFESSRKLQERALKLDCGTKINSGLIVTGDWFVDSKEKMRGILNDFPEAMAVDMESAAIAQVCWQYAVPFISFRIISDIPLKDDKAQMYFDFWEKMAESSFHVTEAFLKSI